MNRSSRQPGSVWKLRRDRAGTDLAARALLVPSTSAVRERYCPTCARPVLPRTPLTQRLALPLTALLAVGAALAYALKPGPPAARLTTQSRPEAAPAAMPDAISEAAAYVPGPAARRPAMCPAPRNAIETRAALEAHKRRRPSRRARAAARRLSAKATPASSAPNAAAPAAEPVDIQGLLDQANKRLARDDFDGAIERFQTVLRYDPNNFDAISGRARATALQSMLER